MTTTTDLSIAKTILAQLGNNRFIAMVGAKNLGGTATGLSFRFADTGAGRPNHCKVELDVSDTYNVTFGRVRGCKYKVISEHSGIYADMLQELFTEQTGLDTHL